MFNRVTIYGSLEADTGSISRGFPSAGREEPRVCGSCWPFLLSEPPAIQFNVAEYKDSTFMPNGDGLASTQGVAKFFEEEFFLILLD